MGFSYPTILQLSGMTRRHILPAKPRNGMRKIWRRRGDRSSPDYASVKRQGLLSLPGVPKYV